MEEPKKSTKDKILVLLKKEGFLAVNDLTEHLNITHMAVRKHLNNLEKDALIKAKEIKQAMGRPLQIYSLTEKGERFFPKNYEGITIEFLQDIKETHGEESVHSLFKKREQRLTKEYSARLTNKSDEDNVKEIVNIQNEKGYMAVLSQIDLKKYELVEYNCPILAVADEFKIACSCETQMLKNVLKTDKVNRICCKTDGDNQCKFSIEF